MKYLKNFIESVNEHLPTSGWLKTSMSKYRKWWNELDQEEQRDLCKRYLNKCNNPNEKYFPTEKEISSIYDECCLVEGKAFNDSRKKNPRKSWDADKKVDFRLTIKNHIKSQGLTSKQIGNDLEIICDGEAIAQVMFRDSYVGVKKISGKFTDEFKYDELGKIKLKVSSIIKNCKS